MLTDEEKRCRERALRTYDLAQENRDTQMYDVLCEELVQFIGPQADVLEIGCGDGQLTLSLAEEAGSWTAADLSEKIVRRTRKRAASLRVDARFTAQDPKRMSFADASFDLVLAANILHLLKEPGRTLDEIDRVLRPEGLLIAPGYVFEGEYNDFKLWLMELGGYRIRHKWTMDSYTDFLERNGFVVARITMIRGGMLPECVAFCRKEVLF